MKERTARVEREGLTYDDVLLVPSYSEVIPREVDISSYFSRNIAVKIPIVTAAMDTVTESTMAIAIAREGGIGVIHKNMTIEQQALEVRKVKRAEAGMILQPITVNVNARVADAINIMREHKIGGIPVVNDDLILVGIITNRDLRFERNIQKSVSEVMTQKVITTEEFTDFETAAEILNQYKIEKLPVVDKQGHLIGLITYKDIIKLKSMPNACKDDKGRLRVAAAVGVARDTLERVNALVAEGVDAVVIDTAHGHSKAVLEMARQVKSAFPDIDIVVGNIATRQAAEDLLKLDIDAIKVGIGPGSICTTRIIAGIGVPQLTAIMEVYDVIKDTPVPLIADGGIRFTGDIVKALAAGASTIMAGSLFAGVDESPGEAVIYEGRKYKTYRGMGSIEAMQKGSKDRYFQDMEDDIKKLVPEGIVGRVPYKGSLNEVVTQMVGGMRSGMGYTGCKNISELRKATFIRITQAGIIESHPHDVTIISEAPNYSR
ncbi:MAG TPA: IMP dehydrogenase [Bacteroidales bacterium]|jgi:IMP dehydrogenase|nr:IMP dehydrogenase [Bacteroidales bacterium]MDI9574128.1 IMP dehydrogenase [Bacteroidota bacterium]OQC61076.1 MAG: Inosine-5'-monophosphate dehydrogenase [Bacteroidetes bacterium ADurb.Bin012]MBP9511684.1 IMP dehydrogenase [Bacteroidales bacterium]MBP9588025.1 IMP dehydrogenase [Bacteroidales bacterium]